MLMLWCCQGSENTKPKKLSMQEQMLADAMAQTDEDKVKAIGSTVESKTGKTATWRCADGSAARELEPVQAS